MTHVLRWCTLAGITAGLLGLAVPASAATGWTVVTPPALPPGTLNYLNGSFALSDTSTWVVGESENASTGAEAPLVLNWNGTTWAVSPSSAATTPASVHHFVKPRVMKIPSSGNEEHALLSHRPQGG